MTQLSDQQKIIFNNLCKEIMLPVTWAPTTLSHINVSFIIEPKVKSKYKFSRNWYEGKFDWRLYDDVHSWCEQNFGKQDKSPDAWSRWWHKYEDMILFRDEADYLLFLLAWTR